MATERISRFFERLGFKLRNARTSWGGTSDDAVMLRSWSDEMRHSPRRVQVLINEKRSGGTTQNGRNERKAHLRAMWRGGIPAYTVIVTPKFDKATDVRSIGDFRSDAVFPIERLVEEDDKIFALLGAPISVEALPHHMQTHRVEASVEPVPLALTGSSTEVPSDALDKVSFLDSAVREFLIEAAERRKTVTYGEVFDAFDLNRLTVAPVLSRVGHACLSSNEPILTALVVLKSTGRCSTGLEREFSVDEDVERQRVFSRWAPLNIEAAASRQVDWTDEELQASVVGYAEMMRLDDAGTPYIKAHYYRQLAKQFGRVEGAFERRMQNISYLLDSRGLKWLHGLKPQENVGANVEPRLVGFLSELFVELTPPQTFPEEISDLSGVVEGAKKQIIVNAYERDATAKPRCIKRWGSACVACGFDFHAVYGELGEGFIHVHHLRPIHTIGEEYVLDPENDLRPVCPNCHSMLHRKKDVLSIEELVGHLKLRFNY